MPFLIFDFAPDPIWNSLYMRKILFSFSSVHPVYVKKCAKWRMCTVVPLRLLYSLVPVRKRMKNIHPWTLQQCSGLMYSFSMESVITGQSHPHPLLITVPYPQSMPSARLSLPSCKLGLPTSSPTSDCYPLPLGPRGETHSLAGGGGDPIPTKGQTFWYSLYTTFPSFTLFSCMHVYRFFSCFLLWRRLVTEAFISGMGDVYAL